MSRDAPELQIRFYGVRDLQRTTPITCQYTLFYTDFLISKRNDLELDSAEATFSFTNTDKTETIKN